MFRPMMVAGLLIALALPCLANDADKRICVLSSVEKLPSSPGAVIGDAVAEERAPAVAVSAIVDNLQDTEQLAKDLDPAFIILNDKFLRGIQDAIASGQYEEAKYHLREAIIPKTNSVYFIKIPFKVAGQEAFFETICLVSIYDRPFVIPLGLR